MMEDFRAIESAAERFYADRGFYPNDVGHAVTPAGLDQYLKGNPFQQTPAIGGQWDWNNFPDRVSVRAINGTWSQAKVLEFIDSVHDDGQPLSGRITTHTDGVCEYWIQRK